jgi:hypothetical protein
MGYVPNTADIITNILQGSTNVESIIRANTLDQLGAPAANLSMNSKRLTTLAQGVVATDSPDLGQLAGLQYAYVVSGCVWTADASTSTLAGSMTAGTVMIKGILLTVAAVTSRSFTASVDTYVDLTDAGNGTATITYTTVANNAMSPTLTGTSALDTCRIAIIVSTASALTTGSATINQGQVFSGPATTAATTTVAAGSNTQSITALTSSQLSVAANSLPTAGLIKVVASNAPAGFEAVCAYTGGGGTTTLTGINNANVLSGNGTVSTGNAVTQVANWTVADGLGNLIFPTRPRPGIISFGIKPIGAVTHTLTANTSPVANLTRRFIVPPGPSVTVKLVGHIVYESASAAAGNTFQSTVQYGAPGVALSTIAVSLAQVAVASDGVPMHPEGIAQLAPGTYILAVNCAQGAAGTLTVDGTFLASSAWAELL